MNRSTTLFLASILALSTSLLTIPSANAQSSAAGLGYQSFGVRGGLTLDPDQVHFGVHANLGHFIDQLRFQPSFELGLGNDFTVGAFNIDALYFIEGTDWRPYFGGGLGIIMVDISDSDSGFDSDAGLNLVGGIEFGARFQYMLEARVGVGDLPDFKLTAGFTF